MRFDHVLLLLLLLLQLVIEMHKEFMRRKSDGMKKTTCVDSQRERINDRELRARARATCCPLGDDNGTPPERNKAICPPPPLKILL